MATQKTLIKMLVSFQLKTSFHIMYLLEVLSQHEHCPEEFKNTVQYLGNTQ